MASVYQDMERITARVRDHIDHLERERDSQLRRASKAEAQLTTARQRIAELEAKLEKVAGILVGHNDCPGADVEQTLRWIRNVLGPTYEAVRDDGGTP